MSTFITVLIIIASVLLILLVLVQNSKGGGLASGFSGGNQVMGAPKTADFLEKATWTLVGVIVFLSIVAVAFTKKNKPDQSNDAPVEEQYTNPEGEEMGDENTVNFDDEAGAQENL